MSGFFDSSSWQPKTKHLPLIPLCGQCGLYKQCLSPKMAPTGKGRIKILFVGEAPGKDDDEEGTQLIGDAGQSLRAMLDDVGVDLDDCWKTNAAICRPAKDALKDLHIESCRPNLIKTIRELKPKVVVLLGAAAVKSMIEPEWNAAPGAIGQWVGWRIPSGMFNTWICPTYHPSYLLQQNENEALAKIITGHLKRAVALVDKPCEPFRADDLSRNVELITDPRAAKLRLQDLSRKTGILSWDYETTGLKPERPEHEIYTAAFCLDGEDTFACRINHECHDALRAVLLNPDLKKSAANSKFEHRWSKQKLGVRVRGWYWDSMQTTHILDNRQGICSLKFQAYIRLGIGDYSSSIEHFLKAATANGMNTIREAPILDLLRYNGMDTIVDFKVMMQQRKEMGL